MSCHPSDLDSTQGDRGLTILGDIEPVLVQSVCNKCGYCGAAVLAGPGTE